MKRSFLSASRLHLGAPRGMDFDLAGYSVAVLTPDEKRI